MEFENNYSKLFIKKLWKIGEIGKKYNWESKKDLKEIIKNFIKRYDLK
jgi:hypothetical protein